MGKNYEKFRYVEVAIPLEGELLQELEQIETDTNISVNQSLLLYATKFSEMQRTGLTTVTTRASLPTVAESAKMASEEQAGFGGASDEDLDDFAAD